MTGPATVSHSAAPRPALPAWLPSVTSLAVIALLLANYFGAFADLDFTWQIRTGEKIVQSRQLRTPDTFSYTINGTLVPDFEWLYEVTLWVVWSGLGVGGLKMLQVVLVAAPLVLLALRLRAEGVRPHGIFLSIVVAVAVLNPVWNLRPLYCTTIGLLLASWMLHDHCSGQRPLSLWLPVVMLLWANLHPGVIVGQGLLLGAIAWEWLNRRVQWNAPLTRPACWRLTVIGGLALAATFLSPDPIDRLLYPFRPELAHPVQRIFSEMQPLHAFILRPPYMTNLTYIIAILVGLTVVFRFLQYRPWEVALLVGLGGLASLAFRSLQDWLLNMLALGVPHLVVLFREAVRRDRRRPWVAGLLTAERSCKRAVAAPFLRFQWAWPAAAGGLLLFLSLIPPVARSMPVADGSDWPVAALDRIEELGLKGRFFSPADYGSYLTWRLRDRAQDYVDTRGFFFPPALIEDSHYLPQLTGNWRERLERVFSYQPDYFLLETQGPRGELWRALKPHVGPPLYLDEQAVLLSATQVRRGAAFLEPSQTASR